MKTPVVIAVGGFASDTGKTTLVCRLLGALPGSEAIKTTRGHYRSCGKDPRACCVAPLLGPEPLVSTGRAETYTAGKDTGRYWDAGAANVHWVIAASGQVEDGFRRALSLVRAPLVIVEGNSFLQGFEADFVIMAVSPGRLKIKPTARRILSRVSAFYLASAHGDAGDDDIEAFNAHLRREGFDGLLERASVYTQATLGDLIARVKQMEAGKAFARGEASQPSARIVSELRASG